jgi:hypothetical protein
MLITTATAEAEQRKTAFSVDGQPYQGREYIGVSAKPGMKGYGENIAGRVHTEVDPQAYLVIQPPHSVTQPHFHQTNQFQVVVAGGGTIGKMRTDPLTVQYAGADTPYGPINAEAKGISYFTLRQCWDSGAKYLPAQRDLLVKGKQRQLVGVKAQRAARNLPEAHGIVTTEDMIPAEPDGLFAQFIALGPDTETDLPDSAAGGGQYHLVVTGSMVRNGAALPPLSLEFASPEEGPVHVTAGPEGLGLLLLRFPKL